MEVHISKLPADEVGRNLKACRLTLWVSYFRRSICVLQQKPEVGNQISLKGK